LWRRRRTKKESRGRAVEGRNGAGVLIHTRSQFIHRFLTIESGGTVGSNTGVSFGDFQYNFRNAMKLKEKNQGEFVGKFPTACG
jgi:hypothetical protein